MSWAVERTAEFWEDYGHRVNWYLEEGGSELARRLEAAIAIAIERIAVEPTLGRKRRFRHPELRGLRSISVAKPFQNLLLFYRCDREIIKVWRVMHGAQNLGPRLLEPND